jgi:hypothetical protein
VVASDFEVFMTKHQYYCKDCGTKREGLLDHPAVGIGGYSWDCPRCNGTVDSEEVEPAIRKPMAEEEIKAGHKDSNCYVLSCIDPLCNFSSGVRFAEKHHGIGGDDD